MSYAYTIKNLTSGGGLYRALIPKRVWESCAIPAIQSWNLRESKI